MKKILTLVGILCIVQIQAQLVSYEKIDSFTVAELQNQVNDIGFGGFIEPIYPIDLYRVLYRTEFLDSTTVVSGVLAVPRNTTCKVPLASYQHGTSSSKFNVPSYNADEKNIAIFFASIGNVMLAPDYIGLGSSTIALHPYMHHYSQAHSTINLLRAAKELNEPLNLNIGNQIFLFGYSQGGSVTVAAVKHIEEDYHTEFRVTAAAPMSGAYSLSQEQFNVVNAAAPYATPGYLPYIIFSYQMMYGDLYNTPSEIFKAPYDTLMPELFDGHNLGIGSINNQAAPIPRDMILDSVQQIIDTDPNHAFRRHLKDNDLINWHPRTPMRLLYCEGDEQVTYRNSVLADSVWRSKGAKNIETQNFGEFSHADCIGFALLNAKKYFASFYNNGVEIVITYNEVQNSYAATILGENLNDFDLEWSNGNTTASIENVDPNTTYTLSATHKTNGCSHTKSFDVESVVSIAGLQADDLNFKLYPNPSSNTLNIELNSTSEKAYISNVLGQKMMEMKLNNTKNTVDISKLEKGIYLFTIESSAVKKKFIVE